MHERFQKEPTDLDKDAAVLAYAYLRTAIPFTLPYFENDEEFQFTNGRGQKTKVTSFGLRPKDESKYRESGSKSGSYVRRKSNGIEKLNSCSPRRDSATKPGNRRVPFERKATFSDVLEDVEKKDSGPSPTMMPDD